MDDRFRILILGLVRTEHFASIREQMIDAVVLGDCDLLIRRTFSKDDLIIAVRFFLLHNIGLQPLIPPIDQSPYDQYSASADQYAYLKFDHLRNPSSSVPLTVQASSITLCRARQVRMGEKPYL
ncbi:hypothetical protein D3C84_923030 [compost metagenome]